MRNLLIYFILFVLLIKLNYTLPLCTVICKANPCFTTVGIVSTYNFYFLMNGPCEWSITDSLGVVYETFTANPIYSLSSSIPNTNYFSTYTSNVSIKSGQSYCASDNYFEGFSYVFGNPNPVCLGNLNDNSILTKEISLDEHYKYYNYITREYYNDENNLFINASVIQDTSAQFVVEGVDLTYIESDKNNPINLFQIWFGNTFSIGGVPANGGFHFDYYHSPNNPGLTVNLAPNIPTNYNGKTIVYNQGYPSGSQCNLLYIDNDYYKEHNDAGTFYADCVSPNPDEMCGIKTSDCLVPNANPLPINICNDLYFTGISTQVFNNMVSLTININNVVLSTNTYKLFTTDFIYTTSVQLSLTDYEGESCLISQPIFTGGTFVNCFYATQSITGSVPTRTWMYNGFLTEYIGQKLIAPYSCSNLIFTCIGGTTLTANIVNSTGVMCRDPFISNNNKTTDTVLTNMSILFNSGMYWLGIMMFFLIIVIPMIIIYLIIKYSYRCSPICKSCRAKARNTKIWWAKQLNDSYLEEEKHLTKGQVDEVDMFLYKEYKDLEMKKKKEFEEWKKTKGSNGENITLPTFMGVEYE